MIIIYGKPTCGKCNDFKAKLPRFDLVEGKDWKSVDVTNLQGRWEMFNGLFEIKNEVTDAMSALQMLDMDMPAIEINNKIYSYSEAIKELKREYKLRQKK